ncbi:dimethyl sulfoxide reductase anchor subunit family protein [Desulfitobacterium sp.]|uniref:dimethyl sulfoxide reductase anchor subunit family protein n=1 Tax=Desulfitobacterium sp. TaxID=49981 RepID=UPI002B2201CB|nr:DmsC/YnfH family molybdoenzyme membrane anchor subunit [Desulfitobacterium sp.]MEA4900979.1 DmsC/YnfH family molybdoenzyme membrane anchor subunit [Desulfitobacterium sp.]
MIFAEEWPLMTFTLLAQLSIGTFIILMLLKALMENHEAQASKALSFGFTAVGAVTLLALIFSLFHLGDPLGAPRSILNRGSSWLSREILTTGGFLVLWFIFWLLMRKGKESTALGWITAFVGLAAIFSMANIYSSSVRPAWANANTYYAFFGATFAMGAVGAVSVFALGMKGAAFSKSVTKTLTTVSYIGIASVVLPLLYFPFYLSGLKSGGVTSSASAQILTGSMGSVIFSAILMLLGAVLLVFLLKKQEQKGQHFAMNTILIALALVVIGEFMSRYLFYASGISPIIGG